MGVEVGGEMCVKYIKKSLAEESLNQNDEITRDEFVQVRWPNARE